MAASGCTFRGRKLRGGPVPVQGPPRAGITCEASDHEYVHAAPHDRHALLYETAAPSCPPPRGWSRVRHAQLQWLKSSGVTIRCDCVRVPPETRSLTASLLGIFNRAFFCPLRKQTPSTSSRSDEHVRLQCRRHQMLRDARVLTSLIRAIWRELHARWTKQTKKF